MPYPVTYYCPRCGALHELQREGYLADKTVTPYPLEGWSYVDADADFEADDVDGVRITCGDPDLFVEDERNERATGCGEDFYLSFVRFEDGEEVQPRAESERVEIGVGPRRPRGPAGPDGPDGPSFR